MIEYLLNLFKSIKIYNYIYFIIYYPFLVLLNNWESFLNKCVSQSSFINFIIKIIDFSPHYDFAFIDLYKSLILNIYYPNNDFISFYYFSQ